MPTERKLFTVKARLTLAKGRNFFWGNPPFDDIIEEVKAEGRGRFSAGKLHFLLSAFAFAYPDSSSTQIARTMKKQGPEVDSLLQQSTRSLGPFWELNRPAVGNLGESLEDHYGWAKYIRDQMDPRIYYRESGIFKGLPEGLNLPPTYPHWLNDGLARVNPKIVGPDFAAVISEAQRQTKAANAGPYRGRGNILRTWVIPSASALRR